jgi:hypothetical protein
MSGEGHGWLPGQVKVVPEPEMVSLKLSLILAFLKLPMRDNISPKKSFGVGLLRGLQSNFSTYFKPTRVSRPYLQMENISPISFP